MTDSIPPIPVCGIGASAGGIEALQQFFSVLPPNLGLAYVIVLHLAPDRKSELPSIVTRYTSMPVIQVGDHDKVKLAPDTVYVIAPDRKLEITDTSVGASNFERPRGHRNAIDLFFRSLAAAHGDGFAVILSGSGSDGMLGAKAVKEGGGLVLVQDPSDATYEDMPRAVIATGVADVVLPAKELAAHLGELARNKMRLAPVVRAADGADPIPQDEEKALRGVLDLVRKRTGHDFSKYKRATVLRRLSRRMQLSNHLTVAEYLHYLRVQPTEVQALLGDMLISVTTFFRDPEAWAALRTRVIGPLIELVEPGEAIRVWVPGCATGEEAYTLAILFHEEFDSRGLQPNLIIFASDVDEGALAVARDGIYPRAIQADVSEARLERFFRADDDHYRIDAAIRDHIVFAVHNVLRDPPFSKLHLVSCRNLLIYLDRDLQEEVIAVFRYACREHAYLFLGASEMASEDLFRSLDGKHRIFATVERPEGRPPLPDMLAGAGPATIRAGREIRVIPRSSAAEVHLAALEEASPPSVLIDDRWNVQHLSPSASRFFQQAGGAPARRLTDLVRPELRDELHAVLHRAFDASGPQLSPFVAVRFNGAAHQIAVLAQPHSVREDGSAYMLVTFLDAGEARHPLASGESQPTDAVVRDLRERLRQAEQRTEGMRDDHFLTNEDLRAANEELQSLNEEYRSTTEELETSKEELQSINEELQTVNHELKLKLEEVSRTHADLQNFVGAANVAMLFLDRELRIKRFTPTLLQIFNIRPRDLDRPIRDLTHALDYQTLEEDARTVLASPNAIPLERETRSRAGQVFIVRLSPYQTADQREIEGVVATFIEITAIKHVEAALRESERQLAVELELMRRLHRMTLEVATAASTQDALRYILAAAIELHRADLGNVQLLDQASQTLRIVAYDGFGPAFLKRFATVDEHDESGCGRAMRERSMVQISDVLQDPNYMAYRGVAVDAGYRALQSTPLLGRSGELVGVLSVHFREPHVFSERDQQLGDLLSHEAAELIIGRRQQDELVHLNEDLSRRTTELETSQHRLADQAAELVEQDRHREEFLAALGHELRNPLGAIVNSVALLSAPDDRSRRALAVLQRQVRHMTRLVNDLLDITRVKHGRLRLERTVVDLNACVLAVLEAERARAEAKGLQLDYEGPSDAMYADADPERLTQILGNLVSNAVTYTDAGRVLVTVRSENDHVRISVRDTGIGIDPGTAEGLFKPYHQRDQVRGRGGLGLGLSLVKSLVEAHGGTIMVHSAGHNAGSEFSFTIPHGHAAPAAAPLPRVQTVSRQILVVDDQEDVADSLAGILETLGQQVTVAYSGEAALAAVRNRRPEIAFLDLSMPGMGGAELARRLRQQFPSNGLILIALTGLSKEVATAQGGGFDRHVLKPATPESIALLLEELNRQANGA